MATRNFYDVDSVKATFLYAVQTGQAPCALAELLESGVDVGPLLTFLWLLAPPLYGFLSPEERLQAVLALPSFDLPSPLRPLAAPTKEHRTTSCVWTPVRTPQAATLWHTIRDALAHGRVQRAAAVSLRVTDRNDLASLLASFGVSPSWNTLFDTMPLDRVLIHAFSDTNTRNTRNTKNIPTTIPRSNGRSFAIDPRALALWNIPSPPLSLLQGAPLWILRHDATPWWKEALRRYEIDDSLEGAQVEAFYTECFPLDIPDEWSVKERAKSHGLEISFLRNEWAPVAQEFVFHKN